MTTPAGHEQVNLDTISNLTVKDGQLYWKNEKLKTETVHHLVFSKLQLIGALILGIAGVSSPILTYVSQLHNICPNTNYTFPFCADWKARQPVAATASSGNGNSTGVVNAADPPVVSQPAPESPKKSGSEKNKSATKQ